MRNIALQMDTDAAGSIVLDYGVLGVALLALAYFAWHQYRRDQMHSDELKKDNKEMNEKFITLSTRQTNIQEKQAELWEKHSIQTQHFHESMQQKVDDIPLKVLKEIIYKQLEDAKNSGRNNPAGKDFNQ